MMVAGGLAYERGRAAQADDDAAYADDGGGYAEPPPAPPPPAAPAPAADDTSELERLVSMHDSGALTDEEFAAAKKSVLGV
jgi:hypothetical protein